MEKIDIIINQINIISRNLETIESDVKMILQKLPTYQTKDNCLTIQKDNIKDKKVNIKYILGIAVALITGIFSLVISLII